MYKKPQKLLIRKQTTQRKQTEYLNKEQIQMTYKHKKGCSISLVIGKVQIKTTMRWYYTPIGMAKTFKLTNKNMEQVKLSHIAHRNEKW